MQRMIDSRRVVRRFAITSLLWSTLLAEARSLEAQDVSERYRVLVANFAPQGGARDNFGKDVARELRKHLNDMATHQAYEGKDFKDALRKYGLKEEDLAEFPCIKARQLATQENVQLVLCGSYDAAGKVQAEIISPAAQETFEVRALTSTEPKQAAEQITTAFTNYTKVLAEVVYCSENLHSQQYQQPLENCENALEVDPASRSGLRGRAAALYYLGRKDEAGAAFKQVLEQDGLDQESLKFAGIIATERGDIVEGRNYFEKYLELNPDDDQVRHAVAQELRTAGDYEGALEVVEQGLTGDTVSEEMLEYAGYLALMAAERFRGSEGELSIDARRLFEKSLTHYGDVMNRGQADAGVVVNMLRAHDALGNVAEAASLCDRTIGAFPNATVLTSCAQGSKKQGRLAEAIELLEQTLTLDPNASVNRLMVSWLVEAGRLRDAASYARAAIDNSELTAQQAIEYIAATGWNQKGKNEQHAEAIEYYELAASLASTAEERAMPNYFWGYAVFKQAIKQQEPSTAASARASLAHFQRAKRLLESASGYQDENRRELIGQVDEYITIQEALIKRGH